MGAWHYRRICRGGRRLHAVRHPIYSADALVQIEQNTGNSLVQDIGSALANKPPASDAEIQLIQSRLVLGKTVHDLGLDISVTKNTFPVFGAGWDRLMGRNNDTVKVTDFVLPKGAGIKHLP